MGIADHLTCLLRNLYAGQEAVRARYGTTDWFQIEKGVHQGCILSPCLFSLYAEYTMWNAGLDETQTRLCFNIEVSEVKVAQSCPTLYDPMNYSPWNSPGKNTGVGCHFLLQCMKVKSESQVALSDPTDCSLPGSSVHGICQARVLEWGAIANY